MTPRPKWSLTPTKRRFLWRRRRRSHPQWEGAYDNENNITDASTSSDRINDAPTETKGGLVSRDAEESHHLSPLDAADKSLADDLLELDLCESEELVQLTEASASTIKTILSIENGEVEDDPGYEVTKLAAERVESWLSLPNRLPSALLLRESWGGTKSKEDLSRGT